MFISKEIQKTEEVVEGIRCDKCGKEKYYEISLFEVEEYVCLHGVGGFGSKIGDEVFWEIDLCEDCFLELCSDYIRYKEDL